MIEKTLTTIFSKVRWIGLLGGPIIALFVYFQVPLETVSLDESPLFMGTAGKITAAIAVWMAVWWLSEAIPIYATALLPLAVFPVTGTRSMADTAIAYSHPIIFLLFGGAVLALALERWHLHTRFAAAVLRLVGTGPSRLVGGMMVASAMMSMWITSTATTLVMLPIALGIISKKKEAAASYGNNLAICLLLGIAYSASIGGIGTIVGTSPNVFTVSYMANEFGEEISFAKWSAVGVPVVIIMVPLAWFVLTQFLFPLPSHSDENEEELEIHREPWTSGAVLTLIVFLTVATCWMVRPLLNEWAALSHLSDAGIAITGALLLFAIPSDVKKRHFLMDWNTAARAPWGVLILLGGGISLAAALSNNGVGQLLAAQLGGLGDLHPLTMTLAIVALMIFLTELTSNTATTTALIPVFGALALGYGLDPAQVLLPATMAASFAFMLPVATPPNAIVFGTGSLSIPIMVRAGFWLNVIGIFLLTIVTYTISSAVF